MRITFRGTRGSLPVPGPSTLRYGGNTSCVEVRSAAGTLIVLDCGTGAFALGQALMAEARASGTALRGHLLISHTHWDHIQAIPFFAPLFVVGNEWDIYAPRGLIGSLRETLCGQMQSTYFPVTLDQLGATIRCHDLVEGEFSIADVQVRAQYLNHPALTLGYRLEADGTSVVYACDHEPYSRQRAVAGRELSKQDRQHAAFLADADLVIHDAQYSVEEYGSKVGWGHSTGAYAVQVAQLAGAKRLALTHHDPLRDDSAVDQLVAEARSYLNSPLEVFAAAENQTLDLTRAEPRPSSTHRAVGASAVAPVGPALMKQTVVLGLADPVQRAELTEVLQADGVRVIPALDGPSVIEVTQRDGASLVVLERDLPQLNALEVCRVLRAGPTAAADIPIVVIVSAGDTGPAEAPGVTDWLERPFSTAYVRARLRAWLLRTACRWSRARTPPDEEQRLACLHELGLLGSATDARLDELTRRAALLFDVPIALVSVVGPEQQWIRSSCGLGELRETSREASFCAHVVAERTPIIVPDTLEDNRFADNPMVTGAPRIRFYAGFPLRLPNGTCAGSLCLVDTRPRRLDSAGLDLLASLGERVQREFVRRSD